MSRYSDYDDDEDRIEADEDEDDDDMFKWDEHDDNFADLTPLSMNLEGGGPSDTPPYTSTTELQGFEKGASHQRRRSSGASGSRHRRSSTSSRQHSPNSASASFSGHIEMEPSTHSHFTSPQESVSTTKPTHLTNYAPQPDVSREKRNSLSMSGDVDHEDQSLVRSYLRRASRSGSIRSASPGLMKGDDPYGGLGSPSNAEVEDWSILGIEPHERPGWGSTQHLAQAAAAEGSAEHAQPRRGSRGSSSSGGSQIESRQPILPQRRFSVGRPGSGSARPSVLQEEDLTRRATDTTTDENSPSFLNGLRASDIVPFEDMDFDLMSTPAMSPRQGHGSEPSPHSPHQADHGPISLESSSRRKVSFISQNDAFPAAAGSVTSDSMRGSAGESPSKHRRDSNSASPTNGRPPRPDSRGSLRLNGSLNSSLSPSILLRNPSSNSGHPNPPHRPAPSSFRRRSSLGQGIPALASAAPGLFAHDFSMRPYPESYYIRYYSMYNRATPGAPPSNVHASPTPGAGVNGHVAPPQNPLDRTAKVLQQRSSGARRPKLFNVIYNLLAENDFQLLAIIAAEHRGWLALMTALSLSERTGEVSEEALRTSTKLLRLQQLLERNQRHKLQVAYLMEHIQIIESAVRASLELHLLDQLKVLSEEELERIKDLMQFQSALMVLGVTTVAVVPDEPVTPTGSSSSARHLRDSFSVDRSPWGKPSSARLRQLIEAESSNSSGNLRAVSLSSSSVPSSTSTLPSKVSIGGGALPPVRVGSPTRHGQSLPALPTARTAALASDSTNARLPTLSPPPRRPFGTSMNLPTAPPLKGPEPVAMVRSMSNNLKAFDSTFGFAGGLNRRTGWGGTAVSETAANGGGTTTRGSSARSEKSVVSAPPAADRAPTRRLPAGGKAWGFGLSD